MATPKKDPPGPTPPPAEDLVLVEGKAPDAAELISEVARLRSELEAALQLQERQAQRHRAELEDLSVQHRQAYERLQEGLREREKEFRDAWTRRELEIAALGPSAPVRGKVFIARTNLRCHTRDGAPLRVAAGSPLPDSVDPLSVPADAIEER